MYQRLDNLFSGGPFLQNGSKNYKVNFIFFFFIFRKPGLGSRSGIRKEHSGYFQKVYFYKVQDR